MYARAIRGAVGIAGTAGTAGTKVGERLYRPYVTPGTVSRACLGVAGVGVAVADEQTERKGSVKRSYIGVDGQLGDVARGGVLGVDGREWVAVASAGADMMSIRWCAGVTWVRLC